MNPTAPLPKQGFLNVRAAIDQGTKLLTEGGIDAPRLTSEVLLTHAINQDAARGQDASNATPCDRAWLYAHATDPMKEVWWIHFGRYLHQRLAGKPTQHITGVQEFYGREFRVSGDVLIPRPETEHLIEAVIVKVREEKARVLDSPRILDIGTGSGAIAITLAAELPQTRVFATDVSPAALAIARENARRLEVEIEFNEADLAAPFNDAFFDLVVSNPPYIAEEDKENLQVEVRDHEPAIALFAGADGLEVYRRLIPEAARVLCPGGWLAMEIGGEIERHQSDDVRAILSADGRWTGVAVREDLAGLPRVILAQRR